MWPFDIPAKRRAAAEAKRLDEHEARLQRIRDDLIGQRVIRQRIAPNAVTITPRASTVYDDPLSPSNPLSPLSPINQVSTWSAPADEPRHSSSHCGGSASPSHSSYDGGSSHSHSSSHDHSCSSSSYDGGSSSSSSYD